MIEFEMQQLVKFCESFLLTKDIRRLSERSTSEIGKLTKLNGSTFLRFSFRYSGKFEKYNLNLEICYILATCGLECKQNRKQIYEVDM